MGIKQSSMVTPTEMDQKKQDWRQEDPWELLREWNVRVAGGMVNQGLSGGLIWGPVSRAWWLAKIWGWKWGKKIIPRFWETMTAFGIETGLEGETPEIITQEEEQPCD